MHKVWITCTYVKAPLTEPGFVEAYCMLPSIKLSHYQGFAFFNKHYVKPHITEATACFSGKVVLIKEEVMQHSDKLSQIFWIMYETIYIPNMWYVVQFSIWYGFFVVCISLYYYVFLYKLHSTSTFLRTDYECLLLHVFLITAYWSSFSFQLNICF